MAKSKEKNKALGLRQRGESIKDIAKRLNIAKSTISLWCRDIELTPEQVKRLHEKMVKSGYRGRMIGARMQYKGRLKKIEKYKKMGAERIGKLSDRDLLIAGIALYWGEGTKKRRGISFCNSDPEIIKFIMKFFRRSCKINNNRFTGYIGINKIHKNRVEEVEDYWSRIAKIPREQFTKTTLIKTNNKKNYKNFPVYYGTFTIRIKKSAELYYQIIGLIDGLRKAQMYSK